MRYEPSITVVEVIIVEEVQLPAAAFAFDVAFPVETTDARQEVERIVLVVSERVDSEVEVEVITVVPVTVVN